MSGFGIVGHAVATVENPEEHEEDESSDDE